MPKKQSVTKLTPSITEEQLNQLREIMPQAFTEGKIDLDKLHATLGDFGDERPERYSFSWAGKRDAIRILQTPSRATLVPARKESVDFDKTQNIFIEGDNLEALKLLYKPYFGQVKMIYIDPPYNTGNDFVYPDNFADPLDTYLKLTGQKDSEGNLLTSNAETSGRYHSAWLSMMYPRLFLARQLLRDDGFLVVSIDDDELNNLRLILNEILGEENFIAVLVWDKNRKNDAKFFSVGHEYMLIYAKDKKFLRDNDTVLRAPKEGIDELRSMYDDLCKKFKDDHKAVAQGLIKWYSTFEDDDSRKPLARFKKVDARGPYRDDGNINWPGGGGPTYDVFHPITGKVCKKPKSGWRYPTKEKMDDEIRKGNVVFGPDETTVPSVMNYLFEKSEQVMRSVHFSYAQTATNEFDKVFDGIRVFENPKHYSDLIQIVEYLTDETDLIMDFFAGSCSIAHAIFNLNRTRISSRNFICIQLPEPVNPNTNAGRNSLKLGLKTIAEIGKERMRRVIKKMSKEREGPLKLAKPEDLGFKVFKLRESNYKQWDDTEQKDPKAYAKQMEMLADPLVKGWKEEDVLYEVALKEGYGLNVIVEDTESKGVKKVSDPDKEQCFYLCLADKVKLKDIKPLNLKKDDLFICRDIALDDEAAANLALQCRLKTI
ncbi:MAG: site-specific DNA-methyltransferase [Anaerolineales bacterium]|nr:site-specific DNA-methyltransferase [Anaerolineales bacterium]